MPKEILRHLGKVWVCGQQLRLRLDDGGERRARNEVKRHRPSGAPRSNRRDSGSPESQEGQGFRGMGKPRTKNSGGKSFGGKAAGTKAGKKSGAKKPFGKKKSTKRSSASKPFGKFTKKKR